LGGKRKGCGVPVCRKKDEACRKIGKKRKKTANDAQHREWNTKLEGIQIGHRCERGGKGQRGPSDAQGREGG